MNHSYIPTQRRQRSTALTALDELVARECDAVQPYAKAEGRGEILLDETARRTGEPEALSDQKFVDEAVSYLVTRPNAIDLMTELATRLKGRQDVDQAGDHQPMAPAGGEMGLSSLPDNAVAPREAP